MLEILHSIITFSNKCESLPEIHSTYTERLDDLILRLEVIRNKPGIGAYVHATMAALSRIRKHSVKIDRLIQAATLGSILHEPYRTYRERFDLPGLVEIFGQVEVFLKEHE